MKKRNPLLLPFLDILALLTCIITFTPLVIPTDQVAPLLAGIPYTMWTSFLVAVVLLILTYLVSLFHQKDNHGH